MVNMFRLLSATDNRPPSHMAPVVSSLSKAVFQIRKGKLFCSDSVKGSLLAFYPFCECQADSVGSFRGKWVRFGDVPVPEKDDTKEELLDPLAGLMQGNVLIEIRKMGRVWRWITGKTFRVWVKADPKGCAGLNCLGSVSEWRIPVWSLMTAEEIARLWHPATLLVEDCERVPFRKFPLPCLPEGGIAQALYRDEVQSFGFDQEQRLKHLYILGKTGRLRSSLG